MLGESLRMLGRGNAASEPAGHFRAGRFHCDVPTQKGLPSLPSFPFRPYRLSIAALPEEMGKGWAEDPERISWFATGRVLATRNARPGASGGGRESNPPTGASRRTGFEDREGHQSPFASAADRRRWSGR
jgi:hypothetical protein